MQCEPLTTIGETGSGIWLRLFGNETIIALTAPVQRAADHTGRHSIRLYSPTILVRMAHKSYRPQKFVLEPSGPDL